MAGTMGVALCPARLRLISESASSCCGCECAEKKMKTVFALSTEKCNGHCLVWFSCVCFRKCQHQSISHTKTSVQVFLHFESFYILEIHVKLPCKSCIECRKGSTQNGLSKEKASVARFYVKPLSQRGKIKNALMLYLFNILRVQLTYHPTNQLPFKLPAEPTQPTYLYTEPAIQHTVTGLQMGEDSAFLKPSLLQDLYMELLRFPKEHLAFYI